MMRILALTLFTAGAALLASQAVLAADLPSYKAAAAPIVAPAPTWTGCYIGGNLGAGFGRADINLSLIHI